MTTLSVALRGLGGEAALGLGVTEGVVGADVGVGRGQSAEGPECWLQTFLFHSSLPSWPVCPSLPPTLSAAGAQALSARCPLALTVICPPAFPIRLQLPQGGTVFASSLWVWHRTGLR